MGFYIPVSWLQGIHYYFFGIGIFSFASAIIFSQYPSYFILFMVLYIGNSFLSWYMSWWVHKRVKKQIILNYQKYMINHFIVAVVAVSILALLLFLNFARFVTAGTEQITFSMIIPEFIDSIMIFNYFVFSSAAIWSFALRFDMINKAFSTYNTFTARRARDFAIKKRSEFKLGVLVPVDRFKGYKIGSNEKIDALLMEIWTDRKSPTLKKSIGKLELAMSETVISELNVRIDNLMRSENPSENRVLVMNYQKLIEKYKRESQGFEQRLNRITAE